MSAPHTNTPKEVRRHRGPLIGMAAVLCFVAILFAGYLVYETDGGTSESNTSGAPEVTDSTAPAATVPADETIVTPSQGAEPDAANPPPQTPAASGGAASTPGTETAP